MPALFAYLIAVGILIGGGYGALSWLAAPEPVKVVTQAKQKPSSAHTAPVASPTPAQVSSPPQAIDRSVKQAASNDKPQSTEPVARVVTSEQGGYDDGAKPIPDQPTVGAAVAPPKAGQLPPQHEAATEARSPKEELKQEPKQENGRPVEAARAINTASKTASTALTKPKRPPQRRQASRPPEKRALTLMTLRTIEFRDGRRATMLIPYRDNRRAMAIDPEW